MPNISKNGKMVEVCKVTASPVRPALAQNSAKLKHQASVPLRANKVFERYFQIEIEDVRGSMKRQRLTKI